MVVVGGRVAGASTALLLARAGARVACRPSAAYGTDTLSTHGLMRAGVLQLARWGLLDEVVAAGTPPIRRTMFHYADGESVRVSIRPSAGVERFYAPRRHLLDRILVDAAAEAGADVLHDDRRDGLLRDAGWPGDRRLACWTRRGHCRPPGRDHGGRRRHPVHRRPRRRCVPSPAGSFRERGPLPLLRRCAPTGYEWAYGVGGAAGLIPTNDGPPAYSSAPPRPAADASPDGTRAGFRHAPCAAAPQLADRITGRVGQPDARLGGARPGSSASWGPGWALVGDAGYFKDPITTHGITDALRDAELLADAILETLTGDRAGGGRAGALSGDAGAAFEPLFEATEAVASYDWDPEQVRTLLRQVSSAMSDEVDHLVGLPGRPPFARLTPDNTDAWSVA